MEKKDPQKNHLKVAFFFSNKKRYSCRDKNERFIIVLDCKQQYLFQYLKKKIIMHPFPPKKLYLASITKSVLKVKPLKQCST